MYVLKADYKGRISTDLLDILIAEDPNGIINGASKIAEDTILSLAGVLYDVAGEITKVGTARNSFILTMAVSIGLYNIYQRSDDEDVPAKIVKNYDDTIEDLTKISQGKMTLSLPAAVNSSGSSSGDDETAATSGNGLRRLGSQNKRTHEI